jgi:hypothetical protein
VLTILRSPSIIGAGVCSAKKRIPLCEDDPVAIGRESMEAWLKLAPHLLQNRAVTLTGAFGRTKVLKSASALFAKGRIGRVFAPAIRAPHIGPAKKSD